MGSGVDSDSRGGRDVDGCCLRAAERTVWCTAAEVLMEVEVSQAGVRPPRQGKQCCSHQTYCPTPLVLPLRGCFRRWCHRGCRFDAVLLRQPKPLLLSFLVDCWLSLF
ncbi:unnamed protein product, partial [Ectocarpus sp. 13 AM-2016]